MVQVDFGSKRSAVSTCNYAVHGVGVHWWSCRWCCST